MTLVDTADLQERTCARCGAVYGDALLHRKWHRDDTDRWDRLLAVLRGIEDQTDHLAERLRLDRQETP